MALQDEWVQGDGDVPDEKFYEDAQVGPFHLGQDCPEVGPSLGSLRIAHHEDGSPALVLTPGANPKVDWQLQHSWKLVITSSQTPSAVMLKVEGAPPSGSTTKLTDVLALSYAALKRVEGSPWIDFHLTSGPKRLVQRWRRHALLSGLAGLSLCGLLLLFGGSFLIWDRATSQREAFASRSSLDGPWLADADVPVPGTITYPLPERPFRNQAIAPCHPEQGEVEINGGCWVVLKQKPPCHSVQAEYKGECLIPISKDRNKTPRSQEP